MLRRSTQTISAPYPRITDTDTRHQVVNYIAHEYVRGDLHTNNIKNVWELFKRAVLGSYHHLSNTQLDAYLDALEWCFNNRDNHWLFRDTVRKLIASGRLEYRKLTA